MEVLPLSCNFITCKLQSYMCKMLKNLFGPRGELKRMGEEEGAPYESS